MIETNRLKLLKITPDDEKKIAPMMKNIEVMYAWEHAFTDEQISAWIERRINGYEKNGFDYLLAVLKDSGEAVGQYGLLTTELGLSLGYITDKPFWNCGFAFEASNALIDYAFNTLHAEKLVADIRPCNTASILLIKSSALKKSARL